MSSLPRPFLHVVAESPDQITRHELNFPTEADVVKYIKGAVFTHNDQRVEIEDLTMQRDRLRDEVARLRRRERVFREALSAALEPDDEQS